jgi:bifunctional non-homologous end joining protein LigD
LGEAATTKLVNDPPEGSEWLHEIKFDGYRMHARLDRGSVRLLTRTGLDWTYKYPAIASAVSSLGARQAYLDGELCGVRPDGTTLFSLIQRASDTGNEGALVFFSSFSSTSMATPSARGAVGAQGAAARVAVACEPAPAIQRSPDRARPRLLRSCVRLKAGRHRSKRADAPYTPGNRGLWLKVKCLNHEEFVVIGWTDPEGTRPWLEALLLAYYDPNDRLAYAGRVGTGIDHAELARLWRCLQPLATPDMPLDSPVTRSVHFTFTVSPLV